MYANRPGVSTDGVSSWHRPVLMVTCLLIITGRWGAYIKLPHIPLYISDVAIVSGLVVWTYFASRSPVASGLSTRYARASLSLTLFAAIRWLLSPNPLSVSSLQDLAPFIYIGAITWLLMSGAWGAKAQIKWNRAVTFSLYIHAAWFTVASWSAFLGVPLAGPEIAEGIHVLQIRSDFDAGLAAAAAAMLLFGSPPGRRLPLLARLVLGGILAMTVILTSTTRAGLLALVIAVALGLLSSRLTTGRASVFALGIALFTASALIFSDATVPTDADITGNSLERSLVLIEGSGFASGTASARIRAWSSVTNYISDEYRWMAGIGFGDNFVYDSGAVEFLSGRDDVRAPHMVFLTVYARLGVIGLCLFVVWLGFILRAMWLSRSHEVAQGPLYIATVLVVTSLVGVIFESPFGIIPLATSACLLHRYLSEFARSDKRNSPGNSEVHPAVATTSA